MPAAKGNSALYRLSNPIAIPGKLRAELNFWIGFEGVHRNIHLEITVPIKLGDSVLERATHKPPYIKM